jgi:hypothetical protein
MKRQKQKEPLAPVLPAKLASTTKTTSAETKTLPNTQRKRANDFTFLIGAPLYETLNHTLKKFMLEGMNVSFSTLLNVAVNVTPITEKVLISIEEDITNRYEEDRKQAFMFLREKTKVKMEELRRTMIHRLDDVKNLTASTMVRGLLKQTEWDSKTFKEHLIQQMEEDYESKTENAQKLNNH